MLYFEKLERSFVIAGNPGEHERRAESFMCGTSIWTYKVVLFCVSLLGCDFSWKLSSISIFQCSLPWLLECFLWNPSSNFHWHVILQCVVETILWWQCRFLQMQSNYTGQPRGSILGTVWDTRTQFRTFLFQMQVRLISCVRPPPMAQWGLGISVWERR